MLFSLVYETVIRHVVFTLHNRQQEINRHQYGQQVGRGGGGGGGGPSPCAHPYQSARSISLPLLILKMGHEQIRIMRVTSLYNIY